MEPTSVPDRRPVCIVDDSHTESQRMISFDTIDGAGEPAPRWTGPQLAALLSLAGVGNVTALKLARWWPDPSGFGTGPQPPWLGRLAAHIDDGLPEPVEPPDGVQIVGVFDQSYPSALRSIPNPPAVLWVRGNLRSSPAVAVVGTRHPTELGRRVAYGAARIAVEVGLGVVSGLALGCDTLAHQAALDEGGYTVAILGGALLDPQPERNRPLAQRILESGGALVSEVPPWQAPLAGTLVARNRLQSGLSIGVVVAQTGRPGGALHTARFALEQGRPLIVPRPTGSNAEVSASAGNLALTDPDGTDPKVLSASGDVANLIRQRRPLADHVPRNLVELRSVLKGLASVAGSPD